MESFGERLKTERKRLRLTQREMAERSGSSEPSQRRYEGGDRRPDAEYLEKVAALGIDIVYVLTGKRAIDALSRDAVEDLRGQPIAQIGDDMLVTIPRYAAQGAAGGGVINIDGAPEDHLAFPRDWLAAQGLRGASSFLMTVRGDSMRPALQDGDLVMVDRARAQLQSGRIYAFTDPEDGGTRIKRIRADNGGVVLISDNPTTDPMVEIYTGPRADELLGRIIGEVVWVGRALGGG